jgi:integrase
MAVYKRGNVWWYKFNWSGVTVRASTKATNKRTAEQIEAAKKTALAKGEVNIQERKRVPTLREFSKDFESAIQTQCAEKPRTIEFYLSRVKQLLKSEVADRPLNAVDEGAIEKYRQTRAAKISRLGRILAPGSINRELATLRRMMRLAYEWKVIDRVPRIRLLRGEKNRESTLPHDREAVYLAALPHPLTDVATVLLDTGLRLGELLKLDWTQVRIEPANSARFGFLTVLSGNAKNKKSRNIPLSARVIEVLKHWEPRREGLVFHRADGKPLQASLLGQQQKRIRELLKFPADFVLHSLRHTFGTRLGEAGADAFTIMRLMGHSTVTVSQRYVHPSPEAVELAFGRLEALNLQKVGTNIGTPEQTPTMEIQ